MNVFSKIKKGIKDPKKAFEYVRKGGKYYYELLEQYQRLVEEKRILEADLKKHTCLSAKNISEPIEFCMTRDTDIHEHLATLILLTIELNLKNILELGTRTGESTVALLQASQKIGGTVTSIDIEPCNEAKKLVTELNLNKNWKFIQANDLELNWDQEIDHLFIDTSHTYEQTFSELKKFEPLVKIGGIISLHDIISFPEVDLAICDYIKNRKDMNYYKYYNNNGLGILRKMKI